MREKAVKMKSFSLEIPVLVKTIARLDVSIKNIEQIGIDIVNIAETLVSESWEGEATKSFRENMQNWKTDYDGFVNKIIAFKESLEKIILPKAEEINEKALSLTVALGGARGTAKKNIISMEQEGIEELKAKCKSLVFDAYESELEIMEKVSGLCGRLNYHFNIEESIEQNKKIIEEKQEMLEKFKAQLQDYEDSVLELEALTVQEMAKYVTLGGQPMSQDTFKELLKYEDYANLNKILSKSIDELSDIELLVLQAAYENGDTTIIKKYIGRQLDIQHLTYKQFYKRSNKEQQELAGQILGLLNKVAPASGMEYSSREIPLGRDMSIILYNVDDIMKLVKREKEITQSNGDPTMAHKSVASAPEGAAAIMAQYGIHERLEAASIFCPVAGEAIIGIDALIYLCEGDAEGIKKDAMFFGGIVAFKAIGRFIAKPICNYIAKKVSGLKPKVYAKKLFKKLGFDKALKQEEKAVSIGEKRGADLADDVIEGGIDSKEIYDSFKKLSVKEQIGIFNRMDSKEVYNLVKNSPDSWAVSEYDLITPENAKDFIKISTNSAGETAFNLEWPKFGGYEPSTISKIDDLSGKIPVSRDGGDGGYTMGFGKNVDGTYANNSQRAIPKSSAEVNTGTFDVDLYKSSVDIVNSEGSTASKIRKLTELGIDDDVAEDMLKDYKNWKTRPEIAGENNISDGIALTGKSAESKYGYFGNAAEWNVENVKMSGGAGQMNTVYSWGTLKQAEIISDIGTAVIN